MCPIESLCCLKSLLHESAWNKSSLVTFKLLLGKLKCLFLPLKIQSNVFFVSILSFKHYLLNTGYCILNYFLFLKCFSLLFHFFFELQEALFFCVRATSTLLTLRSLPTSFTSLRSVGIIFKHLHHLNLNLFNVLSLIFKLFIIHCYYLALSSS